MNSLDAAWKEFATTGRIVDYLEYKDIQSALSTGKSMALPKEFEEFNEAENRRNRSAGLQNRG